MANEVVFYTSDDVGAPTLNNAAGSLNAVLYACLVTGFRVQTATSVTVAGGVATLTLAGHGYAVDKMVELSGATPAGLNGRKVPLTLTSGTLTFDATGVADGTATGTITVKRPGLGWTRPANTSNVAIFARSDVTATAQVLRVDDTGAGVAAATYARATMLETWSDVNTFTGQAPTPAQLSGGQYWAKGANSTTAKPWILVGDSKMFYLFTESQTYSFATYGGLAGHGFGDPVFYRANDPYGALLGGPSDSSTATTAGFFVTQSAGVAPASAGQGVVSRHSSQAGQANHFQAVTAGAAGILGTSSGPVYPSRVDNGAVLSGPAYWCELDTGFNNSIRGELPGMLAPLCSDFGRLNHGAVLSGVLGAPGKVLVIALLRPADVRPGAVAFNIPGAWR